MAKSTRYGGASYTDEELAGEIVRNRPVLGGALKSPGNSSSPFTKSNLKNDDDKSPNLQAHAQTTENPSNQEQEEPSTAHSMGGSGRATKKRPSAKRSVNVRDADDFNEDEDF